MRRDKSFVYDLNVQRGIVSSRVALLLRSAEIKPQLSDLSRCGSAGAGPGGESSTYGVANKLA